MKWQFKYILIIPSKLNLDDKKYKIFLLPFSWEFLHFLLTFFAELHLNVLNVLNCFKLFPSSKPEESKLFLETLRRNWDFSSINVLNQNRPPLPSTILQMMQMIQIACTNSPLERRHTFLIASQRQRFAFSSILNRETFNLILLLEFLWNYRAFPSEFLKFWVARVVWKFN